jgi:methionyl-tRNA synthetase
MDNRPRSKPVHRAHPPWHQAKAERDGDSKASANLDAILSILIQACVILADQLAPFLPDTAARIAAQCTPSAGRLPTPQLLVPKIWTPGRDN